MWRPLGKPKTIRATKKIAEELASMAPPHDRALSERRLMVYERMLKAGTFRPVTWATCRCNETNEVYRVNGQHTATLLSRIDEIPEFYVILEEYEADTLDDVAKLWSTFDSRIPVRTNSDINGAFASTVPELREKSSKFINLCVTGLSYSKWFDQYAAVQPPERAELLLDNVEFCDWLSLVLNNGVYTKTVCSLWRGPVAAAMHHCWIKSHRAATEFWEAVRDETGPAPTCPDRRVAKFLSSMKVDVGIGSKAAPARRAKQREFFVRCMHGSISVSEVVRPSAPLS